MPPSWAGSGCDHFLPTFLVTIHEPCFPTKVNTYSAAKFNYICDEMVKITRICTEKVEHLNPSVRIFGHPLSTTRSKSVPSLFSSS